MSGINVVGSYLVNPGQQITFIGDSSSELVAYYLSQQPPTPSITNFGDIVVEGANPQFDNTIGILDYVGSPSYFHNEPGSTFSVTSPTASTGFYAVSSSADFTNDGTFTVSSGGVSAGVSIFGSAFINTGSFVVNGGESASGVGGLGGTFSNSGDIEITGGDVKAYGFDFDNWPFAYGSSPFLFDNTGVVHVCYTAPGVDSG
jgi:hypothetical protein